METNTLKDVKAGDPVLLRKYVHWGWGKRQPFYVKAIVDKATKTTITVKDVKYSKITGNSRGDTNLLIKPYGVDDDQSDDFLINQQKHHTTRRILARVDDLKGIDSSKYSNYTLEQLNTVLNLLNEVKSVLNSKIE